MAPNIFNLPPPRATNNEDSDADSDTATVSSATVTSSVTMPHPYGPPPGLGRRGSSSGFSSSAFGQFPPPGIPANFHGPPPSFDMTAPTIRFNGPAAPDRGGRDSRGGYGDSHGGRPNRRAGLGADAGDRILDRDRAHVRDNTQQIQPPTKEEVARTIYLYGITDDAPAEEIIESILRCAGKLRRWTRAVDADGKKCKFGFAEFEDVDALEAATELFANGIEVPTFKSGQVIKDADTNEIKNMTLKVSIDQQSIKYTENWTSKRNEDPDARQFRIDKCKEDLASYIKSFQNAQAFVANSGVNGGGNGVADHTNGADEGSGDAEVVNIPLAGQDEDDLASVPDELRSQVKDEIRLFRENSKLRDMERAKREEELEAKERQRAAGPRQNRLGASPPRGPRGGPSGAPAGPKGFQAARWQSDYGKNGINFVGGGSSSKRAALIRADDDNSESDDEVLEARRNKKEQEELEQKFLEQQRKWLKRERAAKDARQRDRDNDAKIQDQRQRRKDAMVDKMSKYNDDDEARLGHDKYYSNRKAWFREREKANALDEADRKKEVQEDAAKEAREAQARGQTDDFFEQLNASAPAATRPAINNGPVNISLGNLKGKAAANAAPTRKQRTFAELEGLLDDDEDDPVAGARKTTLKPLSDTSTVPTNGQDLDPEDRAAARAQLAAEIPSELEPLFAFKVKWETLLRDSIENQVRPIVEKKVVEYLGVQEELLVHTVVDGIKNRRAPQELVEELEPALEEEAKLLVKKVWRLIIFLSESEARGLN